MKIHIVQRGDTLWSIAEKNGVSFEEVQKLNAHLANPDMIVPGMKIKLPDTAMTMEKGHPYANNKPLACPPLMEEVKEMENEMKAEPELTMPENWMAEPAPAPMPQMEQMPSTPPVPSMPQMPQQMPQMEQMPQMPSVPPQMEPEMMMPCPPMPCYFFPMPYPMPYMHHHHVIPEMEGHHMMPEAKDNDEMGGTDMMPRCPYCHR